MPELQPVQVEESTSAGLQGGKGWASDIESDEIRSFRANVKGVCNVKMEHGLLRFDQSANDNRVLPEGDAVRVAKRAPA